MAYCIKCGAKVNDGAKFCSECGAQIPEGQGQGSQYSQTGQNTNQDAWNYSYQGGQSQGYQSQGYQSQGQQYYQYEEEKFQTDDVQRNKVMGVLSYIGILVLIPLLAGNRASEYLRHHLNQGLVLWITSLIVNLITEGSILGYRVFNHPGWILSLIGGVVSLVIFILAVDGIVSACRGTKRPLPIVGNIRIFK